MSFTPGRIDATADQTGVTLFGLLQPASDGFRNCHSDRARLSPGHMLVRRADTLTVPEMTVLVAGLRAIDANAGGSPHGLLTDRPGALSNDVLFNLLDLSTEWTRSDTDDPIFTWGRPCHRGRKVDRDRG